MSVYGCPHCKIVLIVTTPDNTFENVDVGCPRLDCRAIMDRLDEPEAGNAMRHAFYEYDHGFTPAAERGVEPFNQGMARIAKALEAP